jgi:hypothetical protein
MHPECADYSLAHCPHLAHDTANYSPRPLPAPLPEGDATLVFTANPLVSNVRPPVMGRFEAWSYEPRMLRHGGDESPCVETSPFVSVRWFCGREEVDYDVQSGTITHRPGEPASPAPGAAAACPADHAPERPTS